MKMNTGLKAESGNEYNLISGFIPNRIFDAHIHIGLFNGKKYTAEDYVLSQMEYFPDADVLCGNLILFPDPVLKNRELRYKSVVFLKEQLELYPDFCGEAILISPGGPRDFPVGPT